MFEDESPVAWIGIPRHASVIAADGSEIGTVESVLGDQDEDIFHGLVVHRGGGLVEVPAARVKKMTERHVVTDLAASDVGTLAPYRKR